MNQKIYKLSFILASFLFLNSCEEEKIKLHPSDIMRIDTIYNAQSKILEAELDSLCELNYKKRFDEAVDSIMDLRLEERKKRLGF